MEEKTLSDFEKQKASWEKKVREELAVPYGVFAVGSAE